MQPSPQEPVEKPNFWRAHFASPKEIVAGLFWLTGFVMLCFALLQTYKEVRYKIDGATAEGLVTKLVTSDGEDGKTYNVEYRFDTPLGQVEGSCEVPLELWNTLQVNALVRVQYRAHDPSFSRLQDQQNYWLLIAIAAPLGALFFAIGTFMSRGPALRKRMLHGSQDSTCERKYN